MNRTEKKVLLVGTVVLGITAMIPYEASAQLFRGRHGGRGMNNCPPVCCTPSFNQDYQASYQGSGGMDYSSASYQGFGGTDYGSASSAYVSQQPSTGCGDTYNSGTYNSGMNNQQRFDAQGNPINGESQWNNQQRFDAQGNRIDAGTQTNSQQLFDAQGNRIDAGTQLNSQQRLDAQGNRIDADVKSNQNGTQLDSDLNQTGVQGSADVGVKTPISSDR